jgi:hypothetical protein
MVLLSLPVIVITNATVNPAAIKAIVLITGGFFSFCMEFCIFLHFNLDFTKYNPGVGFSLVPIKNF